MGNIWIFLTNHWEMLTFGLPLVGGSVRFLLVYSSKIREETSISRNKKIESELELIKTFTELMAIAHARGKTEFSEELLKQLIDKIQTKDISVEKFLEGGKMSMLTHPVGVASQDAAIAAIYTLGIKYDILYQPAFQGLVSLSNFKPDISNIYIEAMKKSTPRKKFLGIRFGVRRDVLFNVGN